VIRPEVKAKAKAATNPSPSKSSKTKARKQQDRSVVVEVEWKVENPDDDTLRYRLFFREESESVWRSILPSDKVLSTTKYSWNTDSVPAGHYLVKVEASDEIDNPALRAARSVKLSPPVVIDNQPPRLVNLSVKARQVKGKIIDGFSPIERIEYSLDGRQWHPVAPLDDIFDARDESFAFELPRDLPPGAYTIAVRAFDRAKNGATGRVVTTVR
jgi:hypothetical protein